MTRSDGARLLEVAGVSKSFPGVRALAGVDFDLAAGEVHALVGENGAGKSTLARAVAGIQPPDSGAMRLDGEPFAPVSRAAAERSGVRIVMQELNLIPTLTVAENIFIDRMPSRLGVIDYRRMNAEARPLMERVGLREVDPAAPVGTLGVGQQQMVEIAAGISRECRVLVLDEPTASLTDAETELLFAQIERLTAQGVGVVYISHRMEEIKRVARRITVLRDGRVVATHAAGEVGIDRIIRDMVGRDLGEARAMRERHAGLRRADPRGQSPCAAARAASAAQAGETALRVEGLSRGAAVREVSFSVRRGEVLGFAGLMGSGRTETMRAVFGADLPDAGKVYLFGSPIPARIRSPRDAVAAGIAFLTEDRKGQGLFLPLPVRANVTVAGMADVASYGVVRDAAEAEAAERMASRLGVRCASVEQRVVDLSGGNQQKVVLAKWLFRDCDVLIFDEPTRGIDVGAKFEVYRLLEELAAAGKAIVVVSSELEELLAIADRIAVMSAGRLVRAFERGEWSQDAIMAAALSGYTSRAAMPAGSAEVAR